MFYKLSPNQSSFEKDTSSPKVGNDEKWPVKFSLKMPDFHVAFRDLLRASKFTTWDPQLYFPSEGRRAEDFYFLLEKSDGFVSGLNPRTLGFKGQHGTSRPPKSLCRQSYFGSSCVYLHEI
jgi:hypothetical protein